MEALRKINEIDHSWDDVSEMVVLDEVKRVSEAEYWEKYYEHPDISYEWNNGLLEVKPVSDYATLMIYLWMIDLLRIYLTARPVAKMVLPDFGFQMVLPFKTVIRKPDIGLVLNNNPIDLQMEDHSYKGVFDLCIEALSDLTQKDIERDTVQKKAEYEAGGVREYYILDDKGTETAFYVRNLKGMYQRLIPKKDDVIQSTVLPGLQFRISDLYRRPSLEEMADDEVYRSFVLLAYQAAKQRSQNLEDMLDLERKKFERTKKKLDQANKRAEQERERAERAGKMVELAGKMVELERERAEREREQAKLARERAEQERARAEQASKRADLLAEKLRQLGISPD